MIERFTITVTGHDEVLKVDLPDFTTLEDARKMYREHFLRFQDEFIIELWRHEIESVH